MQGICKYYDIYKRHEHPWILVDWYGGEVLETNHLRIPRMTVKYIQSLNTHNRILLRLKEENFATTQMNSKNIMLNEISLSWKDKSCILPFI